MIYIIEIICLIILSILFNQIRSLRFYNWVISNNSYTFYEWAEFKEKIAYRITRLVYSIPSFSLGPSNFEYYNIEEEYRQAMSYGEKFLIGFHLLRMHIRSLLGNLFADSVILVTILFHEQIVNIDQIWNIVSNIDVDILGIVQNVIDFISKNGNAILIALIILLALYARHLRHKSKKYKFESIWNSEAEEDIKKVAEMQRIIEQSLYSLRTSVYKNTRYCKENIRRLIANENDPKKAHLVSNYEDYSNEIEIIKKQLIEIANLTSGISIYATHNKKRFLQLNLLGLLPSNKIIYFELAECNKNSLEQIELDENAKKIFLHKWMFGIAILNGLERLLKDSSRRKYDYNKLLLSTEAHEGMSKMIESIKS